MLDTSITSALSYRANRHWECNPSAGQAHPPSMRGTEDDTARHPPRSHRDRFGTRLSIIYIDRRLGKCNIPHTLSRTCTMSARSDVRALRLACFLPVALILLYLVIERNSGSSSPTWQPSMSVVSAAKPGSVGSAVACPSRSWFFWRHPPVQQSFGGSWG